MKKNPPPKAVVVIISWLAVAVWYGVILYFSSVPRLRISSDIQTDEVLRIPAHLIEYLILTVLIWHAFRQSRRRDLYLLTFLAVFSLSLIDEWWQSNIPTRTWQLKDIMWDNIGALLAVILLKWKFQITSTKYQTKPK